MRTVRLVLEYDGSDFVGWQRQRHGRSVQAEVERAVASLTGEPAQVIAAGRTDAGVHALGQVAHFQTASSLAADRMVRALNALLPRDITIRTGAEAAATFHARYDARYRVYRYVVLTRRERSAVLRRYSHHVPSPLDLAAMEQALQLVDGAHDFRAFRALSLPTRAGGTQRSAGPSKATTRCRMLHAGLRQQGDLLLLTFAADRFLRHMVRMLVGTVLRVGRGRLAPDHLTTLLQTGHDGAAGPAAPGRGLFLLFVGYGEAGGVDSGDVGGVGYGNVTAAGDRGVAGVDYGEADTGGGGPSEKF